MAATPTRATCSPGWRCWRWREPSAWTGSPAPAAACGSGARPWPSSPSRASPGQGSSPRCAAAGLAARPTCSAPSPACSTPAAFPGPGRSSPSPAHCSSPPWRCWGSPWSGSTPGRGRTAPARRRRASAAPWTEPARRWTPPLRLAIERRPPERPEAAGPEAGAGGPRPPAGKALALEGLVVYLVLQALTVAFLPALRSARETFYDDVLLGFFGPEKHGLAELLRSGFLPTWLDNQYGGEPFLANLQHAVLYPGNLPFWVLDTSTALEVVAALHLAMAGAFMWAYCRIGLRTGRWGAVLAALAFGFGSVTLVHILLLNQLQVIAWMPLVLLFGHLALEGGRLRWVVLCGVAAGLQLLAGHPEEWVYTLFALAAYGLAWTLAAGPRAWPRRALAAAPRLGGAMVAPRPLFAWQLLPTLLLQRHGWRTAPGFDEQYELPARLAFNALLPDYGNVLFGENVGFIGLVALGLAGLGVWAGP